MFGYLPSLMIKRSILRGLKKNTCTKTAIWICGSNTRWKVLKQIFAVFSGKFRLVAKNNNKKMKDNFSVTMKPGGEI